MNCVIKNVTEDNEKKTYEQQIKARIFSCNLAAISKSNFIKRGKNIK